MYQYVKINGGKIMRKLSTKVRRVLVLTAMFVVMASIPVMAAIEYHDHMDTELTVYRANGEKRCVAKTIANTNEFIYFKVINDDSSYLLIISGCPCIQRLFVFG